MSSFLSASNIFLIVLLDTPQVTLGFSIPSGALGNTFPILFQPKWFFLNFDQFQKNTLHVIPQDWWLICWKSLLSGFRSVWLNAKKNLRLRLKIWIISRDLVPSDRAICTIASRLTFSDTKLYLKFGLDVEIWAYPKLCNQCYRYSKTILYDTPVFYTTFLPCASSDIDGLEERYDKVTPVQTDHWHSS